MYIEMSVKCNAMEYSWTVFVGVVRELCVESLLDFRLVYLVSY